MATARKPGTAPRRGPATTARGPGRGPARAAPATGRTAGRKPGTGRTAEHSQAPERATPADLDAAFRLLKAVLERHVHSLQVLFNTPENYTLASRRPDAKGAAREFGVVLKLKTHVSFKLAPLAQFPELAAGLPAELKARLQGKAGFSFTRAEPELAAALDALVRNALARYRSAGFA